MDINSTSAATLLEKVALLEQKIASIENQQNNYWLLSSAFSIFFMQAGFLLLEAGSVMSKNVKSIMMKNLLDTFGGGLAWYICGFYVYMYFADQNAPPFAPIPIVEKSQKDLIYNMFIQSFTFANCASTIASGGSASRMKSMGHLSLVLFLTAWVYPVFAHWLWATNGWLHQLGAIDFAGGSSVHMLGGIAALIGAISVGPRHGRFIKTIQGTLKVREIKGHNAVLIMTGTSILWYGWFSFNGGSSGYDNKYQSILRSTASLNTLIGGCAGGATVHIVNIVKNRNQKIDYSEDDDKRRQVYQPYEFNDLALGILGGLVTVTPCGPFIPVWAATLSSFVGVSFGAWVSEKMVQLGIDDPVDAFATHVPPAIVGILAIGLFATKESLIQYGIPTCIDEANCSYGVLLGGGWQLLGVQCLLLLICIVWSSQSYIFLAIYKRFGNDPENPPCGFKSCLYRFTKQEEKVGLDLSFYDGYAYPEMQVPEDLVLASGVKNVKRIIFPGSLSNRNSSKLEMNGANNSEKKKVDFRDTVLELPRIDLTLGGKYFIRIANSGDVEKIFEIVNASYEVEKDENSEFKFKSMDYFQHTDEVKNIIKNNNGSTLIIAIDTDTLKIVGCIGLTKELVATNNKKKKKKSDKNAMVVKISPFATSVQEQNKGIGKKLIEYAITFCRKDEISILKAWVINWRTDLFEIYKKLGFVATKTTKKYIAKTDDDKIKEGTYLQLFQLNIPAADST